MRCSPRLILVVDMAVNHALVILLVGFAVTSCATRRDSHQAPSPEDAATSGPTWAAECTRWEERIPVGLTEAEFHRLIQEDDWASRWLHPARTMDTTEVVNWAKSRALFLGGIHKDVVFQKAVAGNGPFHLFSSQGIPSTTSQMTVICAKDLSGVWRVVYRAVRVRPCL